MRMPEPSLRARARRNRPQQFAPGPEVLAQHGRITLKPAACEHDCMRRKFACRAVRESRGNACDRAIRRAQQPLRAAGIVERHACLLRRTTQRLDDGRAAADRLDARWADTQVVARRVELHAVRLDPRGSSRRLGGKAAEIGGIPASPGGRHHVDFEARGQFRHGSQAHVRRTPARTATAVRFGCGLEHGDPRLWRGFCRSECRGKTRGTMTDHDEIVVVCLHRLVRSAALS